MEMDDDQDKLDSYEGSETWASIFGFEHPSHEAIALDMMDGRSKAAISRKLSVSYGTILRVTATDQFIESLHRLQAAVREHRVDRTERLELLSSTALDRLADIIHNSSDQDLLVKTAFGVLDRSGHGPQHKVQASHTIRINKEDAECIAAALQEFNSLPTKALIGQVD